VRYRDNAGQNKAKESFQGAVEAKPEVEIWRRPNFDLTKSRPKYSTTSGLTTTTFYMRFSNYDQFHGISGTFESTSGF